MWPWICPWIAQGLLQTGILLPLLHMEALGRHGCPNVRFPLKLVQRGDGEESAWFSLLCRTSRSQCSCGEWAPKPCWLSIAQFCRDQGHEKEAHMNKTRFPGGFPFGFCIEITVSHYFHSIAYSENHKQWPGQALPSPSLPPSSFFFLDPLSLSVQAWFSSWVGSRSRRELTCSGVAMDQSIELILGFNISGRTAFPFPLVLATAHGFMS